MKRMQRFAGIWDIPAKKAIQFSLLIGADAHTVGLTAGECLDLSILVVQCGLNPYQLESEIKALFRHILKGANILLFYDMNVCFLGLRHMREHYAAFTDDQIAEMPISIRGAVQLLAGRLPMLNIPYGDLDPLINTGYRDWPDGKPS